MKRLLDLYDWPQIERVVVLSPHLDDAALSCGGLLTALRERVSRLVITLACGNPDPGGGLRSRNRRGHAPPSRRRREDITAMHSIDCDFAHLGFPDAVYRRSPTSGELIYREPRTQFFVPSIDDLGYLEELYLVLRRLCHNMGRILLISPLGVGMHVDHIICAQVATRLASSRVSLLFYEDFPYVLDPKVGAADDPLAAIGRLRGSAAKSFYVPYDVETVYKLLLHYKTQLPVLFGKRARMRDALASRKHRGVAAEVYWRFRRPGQED